MRLLSNVLIALAFMLGAVVPAAAQLAPGYSGYSSAPVEGSKKDYWYLIRQMGSCLSASKQDETRSFLATEPASAAEGEAFDSLFNQRKRNPCMQNFVSVRMQRGHLRGALAEAIYLRTIEEEQKLAALTFRSPETITDIHDFANCYVAKDYESARDLMVETKVSTRGELQYLQEIAGGFSDCLPEGGEFSFIPEDVRYALAEALYHTTQPEKIVATSKERQ